MVADHKPSIHFVMRNDVMSIIELGALGEFVGAIAVVFTLGYLALQLRQNTRMMRANIRQLQTQCQVEVNRLMAEPFQAEVLRLAAQTSGFPGSRHAGGRGYSGLC